MMLQVNVFVLFCGMWTPVLTTSQGEDHQLCSPVALEEEPYAVEYSNANSRGTYFWYLKSKKDKVEVVACGEDEQSNCNSRISAVLFENYSDILTYARTRIMFSQVSADERDAVLSCVNHVNYAPFTSDVFSCRMRVHAKPRSTHCLPSSLSLRCSAERVFPDIACTVDLSEASLKTKQTITDFTYSSIAYLQGDAEYKNASCVAEFQHLPPGTYSAKVSVNVQSAGPANKTFMTPVHFRIFNFTVPKPAVTLTQIKTHRCLDHNKGTLAVQLKCEAEGYSSKPRVEWKWNDVKVGARNRPIETHWLEQKVSSTFKFQPVPGDSAAVVNCLVSSDTKSASAIFKIPEFPNLPPEFINASNGQLILSPGSEKIACRIPGSGSGFLKVNISCSASDTNLFWHVSPGDVGHLSFEDALVLDQAHCRCSAVHNFFCYALIAEVQVMVETYSQTTNVDTTPELGTTLHASGFEMVYVLSITCSVLLLLILGVILLIACKRRRKRRGEIANEPPDHSSREHIYEDPDVVPGIDFNAATHSLLARPPERAVHTGRDSLGYLKPTETRLPDIVSEFNNGRSSHQQMTRQSVSRNENEILDGSNQCIADTVGCSMPLLESIYVNIANIGRDSKAFLEATRTENRNRKTTVTTHKTGGCVPVNSTFQYNEMYISPLDTPSSSETSLPLHSDTSSNYKSLTLETYITLIESSHFGVSDNEPNGSQLENPKSHTFYSKPSEKLDIKKKKKSQSDTLRDAGTQSRENRKLLEATKNRKSNRSKIVKSSEVISRKKSTRDSNYMELHPMGMNQSIAHRRDERSELSISAAGDLYIH